MHAAARLSVLCNIASTLADNCCPALRPDLNSVGATSCSREEEKEGESKRCGAADGADKVRKERCGGEEHRDEQEFQGQSHSSISLRMTL